MASTTFSLKGQSLKLNSAQDITPHLDKVEDPSILTEVHFGGNTIGVEAATAIGKFLQKATNLKVADFSDIFTGRLISEIPQSLEHILSPLTNHPTLSEIDLSDNAFGLRAIVHEKADGETSFAEEDMLPFPRFLALTPNLRILRLSNNGFGPYASEVIADALLKSAHGGKGQLRAIICGRNRLEIGGESKWEQALAAHPHLRIVRMPQNGIRMQGIIALARGLVHCEDLRLVDFQDNTFTLAEHTEDDEVDEDTGLDGQLGIKEWCSVLPKLTRLRELNLSDCFLTTEALAAEGVVSELIATLAKGSNSSLRVLRLQNNNFTLPTFSALSAALPSGLVNLKILDLEANDVEEDDDEEGVIGNMKEVLEKRDGRLLLGEEDEEGIDTGSEDDLKEEETKPPATGTDPSSTHESKTTTTDTTTTVPPIDVPPSIDPQSQTANAATFVPIVIPGTATAAGTISPSPKTTDDVEGAKPTGTALGVPQEDSATHYKPIAVPLTQGPAAVEYPPPASLETPENTLKDESHHVAVVANPVGGIAQPAPEGPATIAKPVETDEPAEEEEATGKKKGGVLGRLMVKMKIGNGKKDKGAN